MDLVMIIVLAIAAFIVLKVAIFVIKGAVKLAFVAGIVALLFYLMTHVSLLSLIH